MLNAYGLRGALYYGCWLRGPWINFPQEDKIEIHYNMQIVEYTIYRFGKRSLATYGEFGSS